MKKKSKKQKKKEKAERLAHEYRMAKESYPAVKAAAIRLSEQNKNIQAKNTQLMEEVQNLKRGIIGAFGKGGLDKVNYYIERVI